MTYTKNRRDHNEPEIIAALQAAGCIVWQMPGNIGFDLLVAFRGKLYAMEVKMPKKRFTLTQNELKVQEILHRCGIDYHVVTTVDEALQIVGVENGYLRRSNNHC